MTSEWNTVQTTLKNIGEYFLYNYIENVLSNMMNQINNIENFWNCFIWLNWKSNLLVHCILQLFGLPSLMCTMSQNFSSENKETVEVYGPIGLRQYLRTSFNLSRSQLGFNYVVHELAVKSEHLQAGYEVSVYSYPYNYYKTIAIWSFILLNIFWQ